MVGTNRQEEVKNSIGNGEAKELVCTTNGHELRRGGNVGGNGIPGRRAMKGTEKWGNYNSIINKIYSKIIKIKEPWLVVAQWIEHLTAE